LRSHLSNSIAPPKTATADAVAKMANVVSSIVYLA